MPTEIKANELRDVDVSFVSLVKRGANRIPFRLIKKDEAMIDLDRLFSKSDGEATARTVIVKDDQSTTAVPGTMPIPSTPEAAVAAATALLKQNGYSVMLAQPDQVTMQPDAKLANDADDKAAADKGASLADKRKDKFEKRDDVDPVEAKKAEIAKAQQELVEMEKGAAQKSKPHNIPVNTSENKEDTSAKGVTMPGGKEAGGDCEHEDIAHDPKIDKDGSEEKKKTFAMMAKLDETVAGLANLVKSTHEAVEKRLAGVEAKVKKTDAVIVEKVLGAAQDDATPAPVRKSISSAPPLLDTGLASARSFT